MLRSSPAPKGRSLVPDDCRLRQRRNRLLKIERDTVSASSSASWDFSVERPLSDWDHSAQPPLDRQAVPIAQAIGGRAHSRDHICGLPQQLRYIARKIALALVEIEKERHLRLLTALSVEEDETGQQPAENSASASETRVPGDRFTENDVSFVESRADIERMCRLPDDGPNSRARSQTPQDGSSAPSLPRENPACCAHRAPLV